MTTSCCHSESAKKLFSFFAHSSRKRLENKGFEASQEQLLAGLEQVGYQGATLLDIGCGVGHMHQSLLERGASTAVGIDLAPKMLSEAREWANQRSLGDRVNYIEGDFMELDADVETADVSLLDKVVCCYPDAQGLVRRSLGKTGRVYGLIYPRDRRFVRFGTAAWNCLLWLIRSDFRSYVHDPIEIESWVVGDGLEKRFESQTSAWITQVYVRP